MVSILNTVRDLERLRQITKVLARHGFGEIVSRSGLGSLLPKGKDRESRSSIGRAERLRMAVTDLGPSFVKLGQIVSTRPDLVPEDIILELKKLQDNVPPESFEDIRRQVEGDLGGSLDELFLEFDKECLASASVAQVHAAKIQHGGEVLDVVVKVQRPDVRKVMETDLDLLYFLAHAVERSVPESRIYSPVKLVAEFERAVTAELDFALEADNAGRFTTNFEADPGCIFPKVYRSLSGRRVLTLERLEDRKYYDAIQQGYDAEAIAKISVRVIMKQIFEDGFFHADPHPGNIFIAGTPESPQLAMIDLGLVGRLTPRFRDKTVDLMVAAVREDYRGMADALYAIGNPTKKIDRDAYEAEVEFLAQRYLGKSLEDIEISKLISDLVYGGRKYGLEIPADFLMVGKTLMTVEGVGKEIYPQLDVFEEVKPFFLGLLKERYNPERIGNDLLRVVSRLGSASTDLPVHAQELLDDLRKGSFVLKTREADFANSLDRLGRRMFSGMVIAAIFLGGLGLLAVDKSLAGGITLAVGCMWLSAHNGIGWVRRRFQRPDS